MTAETSGIMADQAIKRRPFPQEFEEFKHDDRIHYDQKTAAYVLHDERDEEWEWRVSHSKWVPLV